MSYGNAPTGWTLLDGERPARQVRVTTPPGSDRHRVAAAETPSVHCTASAAAIPWRGLPPRGRAPPPGRYHRPTRHSASTPRPYVVNAPWPVCTCRRPSLHETSASCPCTWLGLRLGLGWLGLGLRLGLGLGLGLGVRARG